MPTMEESSSCTHKEDNIYHLALSRKSLLNLDLGVPSLETTGQSYVSNDKLVIHVTPFQVEFKL